MDPRRFAGPVAVLLLCLAPALAAELPADALHGQAQPSLQDAADSGTSADARTGRRLLASHRYKLHDPVPLYANKIGPFQVLLGHWPHRFTSEVAGVTSPMQRIPSATHQEERQNVRLMDECLNAEPGGDIPVLRPAVLPAQGRQAEAQARRPGRGRGRQPPGELI